MSLGALPWAEVGPGHTIAEPDGSTWEVHALGGGVALDRAGAVHTYPPDGIAIIVQVSYGQALATIFGAFPETTIIEQ